MFGVTLILRNTVDATGFSDIFSITFNFNARDPQAHSTLVFFRLVVLPTVSGECVLYHNIEISQIYRIAGHREVVGPVRLCFVEPSSRCGHLGVQIVRNAIYTSQGGTMYNKEWNKYLSASSRFVFGSHPEVLILPTVLCADQKILFVVSSWILSVILVPLKWEEDVG